MSALPRTRSVGVLGGGIAGLAAGVAFRRALPDAKVILFNGDAPPEPEYPGAAAPGIHHFHRLVGIDSGLFRRRTGAVTVREAEVRRAGGPAFRIVGQAAVPYVDGAALHQLWLRRTAGDRSTAPSWAEIARRACDAEGLGVRFDARAYLDLLGELAARAGVLVSSEMPAPAEVAASNDLAIDTRETEEGTGWQRLEGVPGGLRWAPSGRGEAIETIEMAESGVTWSNPAWKAQGSPAPKAAGRIGTPWNGNTLAIGRAAVCCETFDGQPLGVALAGIVRAIELLPRPGASGREAAEYNRRSNAVHGFLLDWAAERWGASERPPGLAHLRGQFAHRGRIPFRDEDPVPPGQWVGWLLGSGERPRHTDPVAMAVPAERLAAIFAGV